MIWPLYLCWEPWTYSTTLVWVLADGLIAKICSELSELFRLLKSVQTRGAVSSGWLQNQGLLRKYELECVPLWYGRQFGLWETLVLGSTCNVPHVFVGVKFHNLRMSFYLSLSLLSTYHIILCLNDRGFLWGNYKSFAEYEETGEPNMKNIWCFIMFLCIWPLLQSSVLQLEFPQWNLDQNQQLEAGHARAAGPPFGAVAQCSAASLWCCDAVCTATSLEDAGSGKGSYSFFSSWFLQGAYHHT